MNLQDEPDMSTFLTPAISPWIKLYIKIKNKETISIYEKPKLSRKRHQISLSHQRLKLDRNLYWFHWIILKTINYSASMPWCFMTGQNRSDATTSISLIPTGSAHQLWFAMFTRYFCFLSFAYHVVLFLFCFDLFLYHTCWTMWDRLISICNACIFYNFISTDMFYSQKYDLFVMNASKHTILYQKHTEAGLKVDYSRIS